jgi:DNA-directed RNA polymerase specialized sigma subunit
VDAGAPAATANNARRTQSHSSDDTPAMDEIIRHFEGLTQRLARSLTTSLDRRDDLADAGGVGLVRAVRRHDPIRLLARPAQRPSVLYVDSSV